MQIQWKWWVHWSSTSSIMEVVGEVGRRRGSLQSEHVDVEALAEAMVGCGLG